MLDEREYLYGVVQVGRGLELDYLNSAFVGMELKTIDVLTITSATEHRPDLVSMKYYGNYNMGWLIAYHNKMLDSILDFSVGRRVNIPSLDDYYRYYNRNARAR